MTPGRAPSSELARCGRLASNVPGPPTNRARVDADRRRTGPAHGPPYLLERSDACLTRPAMWPNPLLLRCSAHKTVGARG